MKLSIITVNLNNREGLQRTIDSVICQTFRDFEWIVIDGGSTDGSRELIEQYADHFAYWVSEPDKGIYNAMNKGIKVAKGEYLQFLNSGDWIVDKNTLERCFSHDTTADILYGDLFFCDGENMERCCYPKQLSIRYFYNLSLGHPSSFIKRGLLQDEPYDENLKIVSDWKFFLSQALKNKKFEHIDEMVSCFDTSGVSSNNEELIVQERESVLKKELNPMIRYDCISINEMENLLNTPHLKKTIEYRKKKAIYHKLLTANLHLIEILDKLSWKKGKSPS